MAPKLIRSTLILTFILIALLVLPPANVSADGTGLPASDFPTLSSFAGWLNNGASAQLRGVYVPDILADSVVQQPAGQATFVSPRQNILTQFAAASSLGSTGLLAHNFLAGEKFPEMQVGQRVYLVYGDGKTIAYMVTTILQYQALQPESPYSNFIDLSNGAPMSATEVFNAAYGRQGAVVFQTCIAANGNSSWGRLFIVAQPYIQRTAQVNHAQ
jgi:hypothetical protein